MSSVDHVRASVDMTQRHPLHKGDAAEQRIRELRIIARSVRLGLPQGWLLDDAIEAVFVARAQVTPAARLLQ